MRSNQILETNHIDYNIHCDNYNRKSSNQLMIEQSPCHISKFTDAPSYLMSQPFAEEEKPHDHEEMI